MKTFSLINLLDYLRIIWRTTLNRQAVKGQKVFQQLASTNVSSRLHFEWSTRCDLCTKDDYLLCLLTAYKHTTVTMGAIDQLHRLFFLCLLRTSLSLPIPPTPLQDDIEHATGCAHMGVRFSNKSITETQQNSEGCRGVVCTQTAESVSTGVL